MRGGEVFPHVPQTIYHLTSATYHLNHALPHLPSTIYLLFFQQHSRILRVTTFVFYNVPASAWAAEIRSFVFIDIPALVRQFLKLLLLSFQVGGDILS